MEVLQCHSLLFSAEFTQYFFFIFGQKIISKTIGMERVQDRFI